MKSFFVGAGLLSLASAVPHRRAGAPKVTVKNGTIEGVYSSTYNHDYFLGIPFAQPPVEDLRFRNPQSLNTSFEGGVFKASEYAPECFAYGGDGVGYPQSDDCLALNIVRPSGYENESLPVGVWIHGGGLFDGGTRDRRYNLSLIVENSVKIGKPIIGASIAYRLGPWGFLQSQEVSASGNTNMGLRDQRLALHWINENIESFGGAADKVTIFGESAGAGSVGWHLTAFGGRDDGLFRAGIMQSGNPVNYGSYKTNVEYQPKFDALLNATGCTEELDRLDCLRKVPLQTLKDLFNGTELVQGWSPIVDGDFIQRWSSEQLKEGAFVKVPIIDGANSDEGNSFGPRPVNSDADFAAFVTDNSLNNPLPEEWADDVLAAYPNEPEYFVPDVAQLGNYTYPASYGSQYRRSAAYFGDVYFHANRRYTCETWAANGVPAFSYRFNTRPAGTQFNSGVQHFAEVAFVFDNTNGVGYDAEHGTVNPFANMTKPYYDLAAHMSKSWVSFIHGLDPNYQGTNSSIPIWPEYSVEEPQNIVFDANATGLAYAEPDTYRQQGIQWIMDHQAAYRR